MPSSTHGVAPLPPPLPLTTGRGQGGRRAAAARGHRGCGRWWVWPGRRSSCVRRPLSPVPVPGSAGCRPGDSAAPVTSSLPGRTAAGCGLEQHPADAVEPHLGPRVRVAAVHVVQPVGLQFALGEADGDAAGQSEGAGHDGERAGELLAVAATDAQEARDGVVAVAALHVEVVLELVAEPVLQRERLVVRGRCAGGDGAAQVRWPRRATPSGSSRNSLLGGAVTRGAAQHVGRGHAHVGGDVEDVALGAGRRRRAPACRCPAATTGRSARPAHRAGTRWAPGCRRSAMMRICCCTICESAAVVRSARRRPSSSDLFGQAPRCCRRTRTDR